MRWVWSRVSLNKLLFAQILEYRYYIHPRSIKRMFNIEEAALTTIDDKPVDIVQISCEICMKEVPLNDATTPETEDYVVHFCGLECYEQWKSQDEKNDGKDKKSGS